MTDDRLRVTILETNLPAGGTDEAVLRVELRAAKELLAIREHRSEPPYEPVTLDPKRVAPPHLLNLSERQLEAHVERLKRDLRDLTDGFERLEDASTGVDE